MRARLKGDNFERRVKKHLQSSDNYVIRQSASAFPDLVVISKKGVLFIECKVAKYISKDEKEALIKLKELGDVCIAYNKKGKICFCDINYKPKDINIS